MMSKGRGMMIAVSLAWLLLHSVPVYAATFQVGDDAGWSFDVVNWPQGKTFQANDELVFSYLPGNHNVVEVDINGYNNCSAPADAIVHNTGNDTITLKAGVNSFICTQFPSHCSRGVKITLTAN